MKAKISRDAHLWIIAETPEKVFALKYLFPVNGEHCKECGQPMWGTNRIIIDESILMKEEK